MMRASMIAAALATLVLAAPALADEEPTPPYVLSDANAGATPIHGDAVYRALHGWAGIQRIVDHLVDRNRADPRIKDIFAAVDAPRLKRMLAEQICYIAGGPCHYTGRDMKSTHTDMGVQTADFDALVENLQWAMDKEGVPFRAQNRLLAKLAPMRAQVVTR